MLLFLFLQQKLALQVGHSVDLAIVSNSTICDDPSLIRVEATDTAIRLTGLKEGKTQCSFGVPSGPRTLYDITVVAAEKKKK